MARKSDCLRMLNDGPRVVIQCGYEGCQNPAITREYDNKPICRDHWDRRDAERVKLELKRLDLVTIDEKKRHIQKLVYDLANKFTGEPNTEWAQRIIQRMEDGEFILPIQERMAKSALGVS